MSHKWPTSSLAELLLPAEEQIAIQPDQLYKQITVRMWGKGVILRGEVTGGEIAATRGNIARARQFIISRIDARHGALGLVPETLDGAIVTNDFPLFEVNQAKLLPRFLEWVSKTHSFVELCRRASEGTTNRVRLKVDHLLNSPFSLPPLDEQRRIVAYIEALATRIAEARGLRQQAVEEANEILSSYNLAISASRKIKLGDCLLLDERAENVEFGKEYPQVGVRGFGQGLFAKDALDATETSYRAFNRLYTGAVVLSQVKGWEGAIGVCPPELNGWYVSPEYRTFSCIEAQAVPEYLALIIPTPWFWMKLKHLSRGLGGRRERVRPELFLDMEIEMPVSERQHHAVKAFQQLHVIKRLQAETAAELDALLPAVLDRAFRGELL